MACGNYKMFGGMRYSLFKKTKTKKSAMMIADVMRGKGYLVRIYKDLTMSLNAIYIRKR